MIGFYQPCDVFELVKARFNRTPVQVQHWSNRTYYNSTGLSSQNNFIYWRPDSELPVVGAPSSSIENPLFFGVYELQIGNEDPITSSIANAFWLCYNSILENINPAGPFYNSSGGTVQRYGIGTYAGRTFPAPGIVDDYVSYSPRMMFIDYFGFQEFTDGTGAIYLTVDISFSGFKIDML